MRGWNPSKENLIVIIGLDLFASVGISHNRGRLYNIGT